MPFPFCNQVHMAMQNVTFLTASRGESGWCLDMTSSQGAWRHAEVQFLLPGEWVARRFSADGWACQSIRGVPNVCMFWWRSGVYVMSPWLPQRSSLIVIIYRTQHSLIVITHRIYLLWISSLLMSVGVPSMGRHGG